MICHGCGGVVGRDCYNPVECEMIAHDMQRQHDEAGAPTIEEARTLAGLRDGSLVAVPTLGSTLMHTTIAHAHHMSEAQVAAIWRGCIAVFHPDVMARAITEADTRAVAVLSASEAPRAVPVLAREEGTAQ